MTGSSQSIAALQGEIRRDRSQLNDWVTCVSATTPKGKEEIQSLSARISAAKGQIARITATAPPETSPAVRSLQDNRQPATGRIDTWA